MDPALANLSTPQIGIRNQQGITVEQLQDSREKIFARVYAYIMSWPDPRSQTDDHVETSVPRWEE